MRTKRNRNEGNRSNRNRNERCCGGLALVRYGMVALLFSLSCARSENGRYDVQ